jgi:rhamnose utilization protein RhaD (predicted bifunctional aldolase and dehydrogenase)
MPIRSRWDDQEVARFPGALGGRIYTSRLLGQDPTLVLHGGGNTSVKVEEQGRRVLYVKGSGADLSRVDEGAFVPVDLDRVLPLLQREALDNEEMLARLKDAVLSPGAPAPSIETLLHGALPFPYVEHTHADSILAVANVAAADRVLKEVYGDLAPVVPYRHSGFELAKACAEVFRRQATPRTIGLILQFHGAVAFGPSARESYENMIALAARAEDYLAAHGAWTLPEAAAPPLDREAVARLRRDISRAAGFPLILKLVREPVAMAFARRADLETVSQQGPPTPQHAIFTRRLPLLGRDVASYTRAYAEYLTRHLGAEQARTLDPSPRVVLDPELGLAALGVDAHYAAVTAEVYLHDIAIITRASAHDAYRAAPPEFIALAELAYGGFEQALRREAAGERPLLGQVTLVTPGADRHDPGLVSRLLALGAAVVRVVPSASDRSGDDPALLEVPLGGETAEDLERAVEAAVLAFGGLDLLCAVGDREAWHPACRPILAHSPVAGALERAGIAF